MVLIPEIWLTRFSMGFVTKVSISSGAVPS